MHNKSADNSGTESNMPPTDEPVVAGPDARLRAARETQGISVDDVAHDLHLDREVIVALESADYGVLGAPVFIRGYLRSYARLMGLPEEDIVAGFVVDEPQPEEFRTLSAQSVVKPGASLANFVLWVLLAIVILAGLAYLMIGDEKEPAGEVDKGEFIAPPVSPEKAESDLAEVEAESLSVTEPDVAELAIVVEQPPEPVIAEPLLVKLTLSFSEECWVEVSDTQNRLIYGLEKPETSVTVEGEPPFRLFLGNVQAVKLELGGEAFMVPRGARSGNNTARFTINSTDVPEAKQE
jgi:cytoskeleton protein RodZ